MVLEARDGSVPRPCFREVGGVCKQSLEQKQAVARSTATLFIPVENATPRKTVKRLMARTSSQEDAAITRVGMPS
jgi:hypothetical protein